jgi:hypothetical protein
MEPTFMYKKLFLMERLSEQGLWGDSGILIAKGACYLPVQLCGDGESDFVVGWSTGWDFHQPNDSYLQKIDSSGNLLWGKKGVKIEP